MSTTYDIQFQYSSLPITCSTVWLLFYHCIQFMHLPVQHLWLTDWLIDCAFGPSLYTIIYIYIYIYICVCVCLVIWYGPVCLLAWMCALLCHIRCWCAAGHYKAYSFMAEQSRTFINFSSAISSNLQHIMQRIFIQSMVIRHKPTIGPHVE